MSTILCGMQVVAFCDVDQRKIALGHYTHEESKVEW